MELERQPLEINGESYEGRLNVPRDDPDHGVLVVPGAGHGPFGDVFDVVAYHLADDGHLVYRYESWPDLEALDGKSRLELSTELSAGIEVLLARGCAAVSVIAKSFGGGIALSHVPDAVDRIVGWAPVVAVGVAEADRRSPEAPLGEGDGPLAVGDLDHVDVPVRILRGTEDEGVARADCGAILDRVDDGALAEIPGMTHSFNERRPAVVEQTRWYLEA